jgi:hypothetical protein
MNRTEQKERLNDVIELINEVIKDCTSFIPKYNTLVDDYSKLYDKLEDMCITEALEDDIETFESKLISTYLDSTEYESIKEMIYDFKSDIEEYMEEISESKAEQLQERYGDLEEVYDSLSIEDGVTMENVIDNLKEKLLWLKEMKK